MEKEVISILKKRKSDIIEVFLPYTLLYSPGVMPVRRRKYLEKNEGLAKCISSAICAALADDGSQVAFGEAHAVGIVAYLVMFGTMLGDQLEEAIEDGLLTRTAAGQLVGLLMKQMVVVVHLGCYKGCDGGTMIVVGGMNHLPDSVQNMLSSSDIRFADG